MLRRYVHTAASARNSKLTRKPFEFEGMQLILNGRALLHQGFYVNPVITKCQARMHEWLRCASGVGVTPLNCCGLLQCLMIIVIGCH